MKADRVTFIGPLTLQKPSIISLVFRLDLHAFSEWKLGHCSSMNRDIVREQSVQKEGWMCTDVNPNFKVSFNSAVWILLRAFRCKDFFLFAVMDNKN